jgi:hypothetical protein
MAATSRKQMQKLISELARLYLPADTVAQDALESHLRGQTTIAIDLADRQGLTRALCIPFNKTDDGGDARHWTRLCELANTLQTEFGFPAPAVSISGADGYALWLSLKTPVPVARAQKFLALLHQACLPEIDFHAAGTTVELPPCLHRGSGKWAAFIHPGLGASFADAPGLEMAPPLAGQTAFLAGLHSIDDSQFAHALNLLGQSQEAAQEVEQKAAPAVNMPQAQAATATDGLLLRDATLEDIVKFLHAKNIEPTFRHLMPK